MFGNDFQADSHRLFTSWSWRLNGIISCLLSTKHDHFNVFIPILGIILYRKGIIPRSLIRTVNTHFQRDASRPASEPLTTDLHLAPQKTVECNRGCRKICAGYVMIGMSAALCDAQLKKCRFRMRLFYALLNFFSTRSTLL